MRILEIKRSKYGKKYPWQVLVNRIEANELVIFLRDNFGLSGQGRYILWGSDKDTTAYRLRKSYHYEHDPEVIIYFSNEEDLMAFKLRWVG